MAWLERRAGAYRVLFRVGERRFCRVLRGLDARAAEAARLRIEENLELIARGRLVVPPAADLVVFLLSDGRVNAPTLLEMPAGPRFAEVAAAYLAERATGQEASTARTARIHVEHLTRSLGAGRRLDQITRGAAGRPHDEADDLETAPGVDEGERHVVATRLVGIALRRGVPPTTVMAQALG